MKTTNLALVAALAATTILSPARADYFTVLSGPQAPQSGQLHLDRDAIANMGDSQCRSYVERNVRAIYSKEATTAYHQLQVWREGHAEIVRLRSQLEAENQTLFGTPAASEISLVIAVAAKATELVSNLILNGGQMSQNLAVRKISKALSDFKFIVVTAVKLSRTGDSDSALQDGVKKISVDEAIDTLFKNPRAKGGAGIAADLAQDAYDIAKIVKDFEELKAITKRELERLERQARRNLERQEHVQRKLDDIEAHVQNAVKEHCESEQKVSRPSEADITGSSVSNWGARTNGPMFKVAPGFASRPAPRKSDPRCGKVIQQIQIYRNYLKKLDMSNRHHRAVAAKIPAAIRENQKWYNQNCR